MSRTKISLAVMLGVALLSTGLSLAQKTDFVGAEKARGLAVEIGKDELVWRVPAGSTIERAMTFIPTQNFNFELTLGGGTVWEDATKSVTITVTQPGGTTFTDVDGLAQVLTSGGDTLRIVWDFAARNITTFATATILFDAVSFKDKADIVANGGSITLTVETTNSSNVEIDDGGSNDTVTYFKAVNFWNDVKVTSDDETVDVNAGRKKFTGNSTKTGGGSKMLIRETADADAGVENIFDSSGAEFTTGGAGTTAVLITAIFDDGLSLAGISEFTAVGGWDKGSDRVTLTNASYALGDNALTIEVDGVTELASRTINVTFTFKVDQPGGGTKSFTKGTSVKISVWKLNGTVLVAHWLQTNTDEADGSDTSGRFKSRLYVVNHTGTAGAITIRVLQSTLSNGADTSNDLGETTPGQIPDIPANASMLIRMEDVYSALGLALPDFTNGGNVAAVITIRVTKATCSYQTFDEDTQSAFFGTANCSVF